VHAALTILAWYTCRMAEASADLSGKRILIIEDDILLHNLIADKMIDLRKKGVKVDTAVNAEEGLAKVRETKPDLVLLDIVLPGMTGYEFLEHLRGDGNLTHTPVVVLSNLSDASDKEHAKKLGVIAYLVKADFSLGEILEVVQEVLQGHAAKLHGGPGPDVKKTPQGYTIYL